MRSDSTTVNSPLQLLRVAKAEITIVIKPVGFNSGRRNRIIPLVAGNPKRNANSPKSYQMLGRPFLQLERVLKFLGRCYLEHQGEPILDRVPAVTKLVQRPLGSSHLPETA